MVVKKPHLKMGLGHDMLPESVYKRITELIQQRSLVSGQVIIEQRLAEQLGVSRTPLREALQRLDGEGLIKKNAGRSYMIRSVDLQEYIQSLKLRHLIEPVAASLAVDRIRQAELSTMRAQIETLHHETTEHTRAHWDCDDQLHRLYGRNCNNMVMFGIIERLRITTRLHEITNISQRVQDDFIEHVEILDALEAKDSDRARDAVAAHLQSLITYSLNQVG
jgi:DNA-binding GntR family transcriptional regulator